MYSLFLFAVFVVVKTHECKIVIVVSSIYLKGQQKHLAGIFVDLVKSNA